MNRTHLILLFTLLSLPGWAQLTPISGKFQRPNFSGQYNMIIVDSVGSEGLKRVPKTGPIQYVPINQGQVVGLNATISVFNTSLSLRPTTATVATERTANFSLSNFRIASFTGGPPKTILFTDSDGGEFRLDSTDSVTPDDTIMTRVRLGYRFKRFVQGRVSLAALGWTTRPINSTALQSSTVQAANLVALNKLKRYSAYSWFLPLGIGDISGKWTVKDVPFDLVGVRLNSAIQLNTSDTLLLLDYQNSTYSPNIQNVWFRAGGQFPTSCAVALKGFKIQPSPDYVVSKPVGTILNCDFSGSDVWLFGIAAQYGFGANIWVNNPVQLNVENCFIQGSISYGYTQTNTYGIRLTNTSGRSATTINIRNNQIYECGYGFHSVGLGSLAIEGVNLPNNNLVSNYTSYHIEGSYKAPGWEITGGHSAARRTNIELVNVGQVHIHHVVMYNMGNANSGDNSSFVSAFRVNNMVVDNNTMIVQGSPVNDAGGIYVQGTGADLAVNNNIHNNQIFLKTGTTQKGIWVQNFAQNNKVNFNEVYGTTVPYEWDNTFNFDPIGNIPVPSVLSAQVVPLTTVPGLPNERQLDLSAVMSSYIIVAASDTATKPLTRILAPLNKGFTVQFDRVVAITSSDANLRLSGSTSVTTTAGWKSQFINTSARVEEVGRLINSAALESSIAGKLAIGNNLSDVPSKSAARLNLGLKSAGLKDSTDFVRAGNNGLSRPIYTNSYSPASWTTTTYNQIIPPGTLVDGVSYGIKIIYDKSGLDRFVQNLIVGGVSSSSSAPGAANDLSGNVSSYNIGYANVYYMKVTTLKPTVASGSTIGLQATISNQALAVSGATITVTATPLF